MLRSLFNTEQQYNSHNGQDEDNNLFSQEPTFIDTDQEQQEQNPGLASNQSTRLGSPLTENEPITPLTMGFNELVGLYHDIQKDPSQVSHSLSKLSPCRFWLRVEKECKEDIKRQRSLSEAASNSSQATSAPIPIAKRRF